MEQLPLPCSPSATTCSKLRMPILVLLGVRLRVSELEGGRC